MNGGRIAPAKTRPAREERSMLLTLAGLLLCAFLAVPLGAQQVHGVVLDGVSHEPVKGAEVALVGAQGRTVGRVASSSDGRFAMKIPEFGVYHVRVKAVGYAPFRSHLFWADSTREVSAEVSLSPAPVALPGLKVTTTAIQRGLTKVGFYKRKKLGFGYYITPKEIEHRTTDRITDAFRGLPGVRVRRVSGSNGFLYDVTVGDADTQYFCGSGSRGCSVGGRSIANANGSGASPQNAPKTCYPSIYLDGDMIRHGGNGRIQQEGAGTWTEMVDPHDVAAIEVYPSPAGLPPFAAGSNSPCGTVLIWTKTH